LFGVLPSNVYFDLQEILRYEAINPNAKKPENSISKNQKMKTSNTYNKQKEWFDKWRVKKEKSIVVWPVKEIFNQAKLTNSSLWNISFESFKRDFWQKYSRENGLKKKPGRSPKKINLNKSEIH
jgi:hypothetical protein